MGVDRKAKTESATHLRSWGYMINVFSTTVAPIATFSLPCLPIVIPD